jgi:hypothetical protein
MLELGLFYATRKKRMMFEGIFRQELDKYDSGKPSCRKRYNLVMALSFYGRMLQNRNIKRASEAAD